MAGNGRYREAMAAYRLFPASDGGQPMRVSTDEGSTSRTRSTPPVFVLPKLNRIAPRASSSSRPKRGSPVRAQASRMNRRAVETAMPACRDLSQASPSIDRNEMFEILGAAGRPPRSQPNQESFPTRRPRIGLEADQAVPLRLPVPHLPIRTRRRRRRSAEPVLCRRECRVPGDRQYSAGAAERRDGQITPRCPSGRLFYGPKVIRDRSRSLPHRSDLPRPTLPCEPDLSFLFQSRTRLPIRNSWRCRLVLANKRDQYVSSRTAACTSSPDRPSRNRQYVTLIPVFQGLEDVLDPGLDGR